MARRADAPGLTHLRAIAIGATLLAAGALPVEAAKVRAAVAANFTKIAEQIGADFTAATGHEVVLSFGATGTLYTQISQGAPFDVFLAADDRRPAQAIAEGLAVAGSAFTYARGALVLYAPEIDLADGAAPISNGRGSPRRCCRTSSWVRRSRRRCNSSRAAMPNWASWR
jgi:ABC-type molybdate transport system substrate-binding protein